jgi:hypothetical protein
VPLKHARDECGLLIRNEIIQDSPESIRNHLGANLI